MKARFFSFFENSGHKWATSRTSAITTGHQFGWRRKRRSTEKENVFVRCANNNCGLKYIQDFMYLCGVVVCCVKHKEVNVGSIAKSLKFQIDYSTTQHLSSIKRNHWRVKNNFKTQSDE